MIINGREQLIIIIKISSMYEFCIKKLLILFIWFLISLGHFFWTFAVTISNSRMVVLAIISRFTISNKTWRNPSR